MEAAKYKAALIVGAGEGLSASLARLFTREGIRVALAARQTDKLVALCKETGAAAYACDATSLDDVTRLFASVERDCGAPDIVVYNASARPPRAAFADLIPADVAKAIAVRSASVKGYPQSAPFAMGKFALRGLAQSMARELSPQGIHVAHFVIDGGIRSARRTEPTDKPDSMLDPDAIAANYWNVLCQPRSAWTWEMEMRPWVEKF